MSIILKIMGEICSNAMDNRPGPSFRHAGIMPEYNLGNNDGEKN